MRWFKPGLRHSISALLGAELPRHPPQARPDSLEAARQAMLAALGVHGAELSPRLKRRLMYGLDAQALWYARSELVAVLSRMHGETQAVNTVKALSPVFVGLLPKSLMDSPRKMR